MYSTREVVSVGGAIADRFERMLATAKYSSNELLRTRACLALTVGEGYRAVLALLSSMGQSYVPIVLRSIFEAVADLKILCDDPGHLEQMQYDNAKQYLRAFRGFRDDKDALFDDTENAMFDAAMEIEQAIYDLLQSDERAKFSVRRKFERAGMLDLYGSVYAYLCSFAHNNISTLRQRHGASGNLSFAEAFTPEVALRLLAVSSAGYAHTLLLAPKFSTLTDEQVAEADTWLWQQLEALDLNEISSVRPTRRA